MAIDRDSASRQLRNGGFTLLELLVSLLLALLILVLATQLLQEVHLAFLRSRREIGDPIPQLAARWLRQDLREAGRVLAGSSGWSTEALRLELPERGEVRWQRAGDRLERTYLADSGAPPVSRTLMRQIFGFRWRRLTPPVLVELEIDYGRQPARSPNRLLGAAPWRKPMPEGATLRLRIWLRGRGREGSW